MDRKVLGTILSFKDTDLFLRGAVQWVGFRTTTLPFSAELRHSGTTKYSLRKMLKFASGAIVSFSVIPLKVSVHIGLLTTLLAFLEIVYIGVMYLRGDTVPGWASTVGILSFLFGILFINMGIIGTYLARLHMSLQNRPKFIISEISVNRKAGNGSGIYNG
jgi:dolichol-phosphate mannosyltransferase